MQMPDHILDPANGLPAELETLMAQAITMAGEPMIAIIQPATAAIIEGNGRLVSGDALRTAVERFGARPVSLDLTFSRAITAGWLAELTAGGQLTITTPDGGTLYSGDLPADHGWRAAASNAAKQRKGLIIITGARGSLTDLVPAIEQNRTRWSRVHVIAPTPNR
ncbi:hypothetical protein [Nocardia tengchongensis]|uniref:hypothetical protein n=1 Tax=Nocardia tengchongensis TaxID=2055889 RepID=UPI0036105780